MGHRATAGLWIALSVWSAGCAGGAQTDTGAGTNQKPSAHAGTGGVVERGETAILDGSSSSDPENDSLSYVWRLVSSPTGSNAVVQGSATQSPTLVTDVVGWYEVELIVHDGTSQSDPATVRVWADPPADLRVGPGRPLDTPSAAAALAKDGDVIAIDFGTTDGDVCVWWANDLVIRGAGGRAHLRAAGQSAERKAIWVIKGRNTTVEDIEFSGAQVKDKNGAGIRQEGTHLTLKRCYFHDNEAGLLTTDNYDSDIVIEECEFARNGFNDGQSHNIYVNTVKSLTVRACWSHHTRRGHNLKSRAALTRVLYSRFMDESDGNASYAVEFPNGGIVHLIGNVIQQGPNNDNDSLLSFGAEGLWHPTNELHVVNNTFVNDHASGWFVVVYGNSTATVRNNIFAGPGQVLWGPGSLFTNLAVDDPEFVDRAAYDYRLTATSPALNAGSSPGNANGHSLKPSHHYVHPTSLQARPENGIIDIGAFER